MGNSVPITAHSNKRYITPSDAKCTLYFPSPRGKTSQTPKIRIREIILSKNNISKALQYQERIMLAKFQTFGSSKQSRHPGESHEIGTSPKKPTSSTNNRPESINYIIPTAMPSQFSNLNPKKVQGSLQNKENVSNPSHKQPNQPSYSSAASRDGLPPLSSGGKQSVQNTPDWRSNSKGSDPLSISTLTKQDNFDYGHNPANRSTTPSKMAVTSVPIPLPSAPNFMKHALDTHGIKSNDSTLRENNFRINSAQLNTEPNVNKNFNFNTPSKTESVERYDSTDRSRSKEIPARKHRLLLSSSAKKLKIPDSYSAQESTLFNTTTHRENSTTALLLQTGYNNPFADGSTKAQDLSQSVKKELTKLSQIPMISTSIIPNYVTINNYLGSLNSGNVTGSSLQSKASPQDSKIPKLPGLTIPIRKPEDFKYSDYSHSGDKNRTSHQPLLDIPLSNHPINDSRGSSISGIPHSSSRPYTVDNSLQIDTNLLRDTSSSPINAIVNSILYRNNSPGYPSPVVQAIKSELATSTYRSKHDTFGLESDPNRSSKLSTFRDTSPLESAKISQLIPGNLSQRSTSPITDSNARGISSRLDFGEMPHVQKVLLKEYLSPRTVSFPDPPRLSPVGKLDNKVVLSPFLSKSPLRDERVTPIKADQSPSPKPTPNIVSPKKTVTPTSSPQKYNNPFSPMIANKEVGISKQSPKASPQNRQISPQHHQVSPKNLQEKSPTNNSSKKTPPKEKFPIFKISTPDEKSPQKSVGSPKDKFHLIQVNSPDNRMQTSPDQSNRQYSVRSPAITDKYTSIKDGSPAKLVKDRNSPANKKSISPKARNLPPLDSKSPKASESKSPKSIQSKSPKGTDTRSPKSVETKSPKALDTRSPKAVESKIVTSPKIVEYSIKDKYTRIKSPSAEKSSRNTSIPEKSLRSPKQEKSINLSKSKPEPKSLSQKSYASERSVKEIPVIDDKPHEVEEYFLIEASPIVEQFPAISDSKFDPIIEKSGERFSSIRSSPKSENSVKHPSPKRIDISLQNLQEGLLRETQSLSLLQMSPGPSKIASPIKQKFPSPKKDLEQEKIVPPSNVGTSISSNEEQSPFIKFLKDSSRELSQNRKLLKKSSTKFPIKIIDYPDSSRKTPEIDPFSGIIGSTSAEKRIPQSVTAYELALSKVFPSKSPKLDKKYTPHSVKNISNRSMQDSKAYNSERSYEAAFNEAKTAHQEFINQSSQQNGRGITLASSREHPSAEAVLMNQIQGSSHIQQDPMIVAQLQALNQVKEDMLISLTEAKLQKIQDVFVQKIDTIHKDLLTRIESLQNTNNSTNTHSQPSNNNTQKSSAHSNFLESERIASKSPLRAKPVEKIEQLSKSPRRSNESSKIMSNVPESNTESESYYPKPSSEEKLKGQSSSDDNKRIAGKSKISAKVIKLIKAAGGNNISQKKLSTLLESDKKDSIHRFSFGGAHDPSKRIDSSPNKIPMTNKELQRALSKSPSGSPQKNTDSTIKPNVSSLALYQKILGESPLKKTSHKKKRNSQSPGSGVSSENGSPQRKIIESPLMPKIDLYSKIKNPSLKNLRKPSPAGYETSPQKSKPVTPAKNTKSSSKKDSSPDTVFSQLKAKGTPQTKSSKSKKDNTNTNSRAISPSDIKASPLQSASKLLGFNPNLEGSHFNTHIELFPSTERFGRSTRDRDRDRIHPVPQIRGLESLNPLENQVVIDANGIHSPPQQNYPTLEKELEEAFEAAASQKDHSGTKYESLIAPKQQIKTGPTLLTSSNLMTLSPEKTSETRLTHLHLEKHYIQTELNQPKLIKGIAADSETTNKSASFKQKDKSINYEKEEEAYLRRVFNQKQSAISPILAPKNSDPKGSGSSFGHMKPKYHEESIENVPPREQQSEVKSLKRIGSRQNSVSKNDPSSLFYFEKKENSQIIDIPSGQSAEYSSVNVDHSSSIPAVGETAFEREKRLRDEIKYLKSKLKDLTVKGLGVSPNKLIKAKSKKLKAKASKTAAKTFEIENKEAKSVEPTHKRQRSSSKSVPKSREHTPNNNALSKKMSASVVEGLDIECRKLSNTPIKFEMQRNASANLNKRKSSIEDINKKMGKTSTATKIKQNAINRAQEKFFEEYSNKINDNDTKKVSNKNLEIEEVMRVGRSSGMMRSSSIKAAKH